jgi:hypothetical protein
MSRRKSRKATSKKDKPSAQPKPKPTTLADAIREALPRMPPKARAWCEKLLAGDEAERKEAQATTEESVTSERPVTTGNRLLSPSLTSFLSPPATATS